MKFTRRPSSTSLKNEPHSGWNISTIRWNVIAGLLCVWALTHAGTCDRYERKMNRRENMRHYIDSVRTQEQRQKDSIRHQNVHDSLKIQ